VEITGWDNVIFTTAAPRDVFARLLSAVLVRWPDALVDVEDGEIQAKRVRGFSADRLPTERASWLFFRDAAMLQHMEDAAYSPMVHGEGPFAVISRARRKIEFDVSGVDERNSEDGVGNAMPPEPYQAWICAPEIVEITVVTPGDPAELDFARWALGEVKRCCVG